MTSVSPWGIQLALGVSKFKKNTFADGEITLLLFLKVQNVFSQKKKCGKKKE